MSADEQKPNVSKPNNPHALRDKLQSSLKQRLGRKGEAAAAKAVDDARPPRPAAIPGPTDESFLEELENEARREVELLGAIHITNEQDMSHLISDAESSLLGLFPPDRTVEPVQAVHTEPDIAADSPHENEGTFDGKNRQASSSLANMLKASKAESKKTSSLKSPRQSAQSTGAEPSADASSAHSMVKKDTFLKQPRGRVNIRPDSQPELEPETTSGELTHEQKLMDAIKKQDLAWISQHAKPRELSPARQEILLIYALPHPDCAKALLDAGLEFKPIDGLALKAALSQKNFAVLEMLRSRGASIDLDTLKSIAAWRRQQSTVISTSHSAPAPEPLASSIEPARLIEDFEHFLTENSENINPEHSEALTPVSPTVSPPISAPISTPVVAEAGQDNLTIDLGLPDDKTTTSLSIGHERLSFDEIKPEPPAPLTSSIVRAPTQMKASDMSTTSEKSKPSNGSVSISSTADRARLAMLDKVSADKQRLELEVMELRMYAEAAVSLEQERDTLMEDVQLAREEVASLSAELKRVLNMQLAFDDAQSALQGKLDRVAGDLTKEKAERLVERDEAVLASNAFGEQIRETCLRENTAIAEVQFLVAKVAELEKRETPAPEARDWLRGSEKEKQLGKDMFIEAVIEGDHKVLDKLSKNTALDSSTAHLALVFAAEAGEIKCAQWLLDHMDIHPGFGGEISLLRAVESKKFDMVRWLVARGADLHRADEFALRMAVHSDDTELMDFLVGLGANPRAADDRALREAATHQSWKCFKALLALGCTGRDAKGELSAELADLPEAQEHFEWIKEQRALEKTLDPEFCRRARAPQPVANRRSRTA